MRPDDIVPEGGHSAHRFTVELSPSTYTKHMAAKYYTHFLTGDAGVEQAAAHEWTGVVELREPLRERRELGQLRSLLAVNFDLDWQDIRILQWARLH